MYKLLSLLLTSLAFGIIPACHSNNKSADLAQDKALEGIWLNSHEETRGDTLVYRPNRYKFPPTQGRTGFAIRPYGRFEQFDIAPTGGLEGRLGTWTAVNSNQLRIHLTEGPEPDYTLQLISLKKKVLKVRRLP